MSAKNTDSGNHTHQKIQQKIQVWIDSTGAADYGRTYALQKHLVQLRIQNKIPNTLLVLMHKPTVTLGRGNQGPTRHLTPNADSVRSLLPVGVDFYEIERGGGTTAHEFGQVVFYPIFKLDGNSPAGDKDIGFFIQWMLNAASRAVEQGWGIESHSEKDATGLWVNRDSGTPKLKIASLGIAFKQWVSYHGLSLNVFNSGETFKRISPCGYSSEVMIQLESLRAFDSGGFDLPSDWRARFSAKDLENLDPRFTKAAKFVVQNLFETCSDTEPEVWVGPLDFFYSTLCNL